MRSSPWVRGAPQREFSRAISVAEPHWKPLGGHLVSDQMTTGAASRYGASARRSPPRRLRDPDVGPSIFFQRLLIVEAAHAYDDAARAYVPLINNTGLIHIPLFSIALNERCCHGFCLTLNVVCRSRGRNRNRVRI